jgi:hypothetical protein
MLGSPSGYRKRDRHCALPAQLQRFPSAMKSEAFTLEIEDERMNANNFPGHRPEP